VDSRNLTIGGYMPFYKREDEQLLVGGTMVRTPNVTLTVGTKDQYTYPQDGWYWFDTLDEAMSKLVNKTDSITPRQARLKLLEVGLLDDLEAIIATNRAWQIEWEYATEVKRNSPLMGAVATQAGLTSEQIDQIFLEASQL